jgi:hypothetical protein
MMGWDSHGKGILLCIRRRKLKSWAYPKDEAVTSPCDDIPSKSVYSKESGYDVPYVGNVAGEKSCASESVLLTVIRIPGVC